MTQTNKQKHNQAVTQTKKRVNSNGTNNSIIPTRNLMARESFEDLGFGEQVEFEYEYKPDDSNTM